MRKRDRVSPFAAGMIAIGTVVLAVYFAFGGSLPFSSQYEVYAQVRSANELHSRTSAASRASSAGRAARQSSRWRSTTTASRFIGTPP
jgi:hypothetical protein